MLVVFERFWVACFLCGYRGLLLQCPLAPPTGLQKLALRKLGKGLPPTGMDHVPEQGELEGSIIMPTRFCAPAGRAAELVPRIMVSPRAGEQLVIIGLDDDSEETQL